MKLVLLVAALVMCGCASETSGDTGILLRVTGASSIRERASKLHVRVRSGDAKDDPDDWSERGNYVVKTAAGWPVEIGIRATDEHRRWLAELLAMDDDGGFIAEAIAMGGFSSGAVTRVDVQLLPCDACSNADALDASVGEDPDSEDGGVETRDAQRDSTAHDASMCNPITCPVHCERSSIGNYKCCTTDDECGCSSRAGGTCIVPQDAGSASVVHDASQGVSDAALDASSEPPDAGGLQVGEAVCPSAPAYPVPDACSKCICVRCAAAVSNCHAGPNAAKNMQCKLVQECAQSNHCIGDGCFCGNDALCLVPTGPCVEQLQQAVGSTISGDYQSARNTAQSSVANWFALGECEKSNCKSECGL